MEKTLMDKKDAKVLLLYLLRKIYDATEANNIPIYASGGTCLGMVRHKGMIPWDDDIDLMIFRKDYGRFVKACTETFEEPVAIRTRENDPFFCQEYIKICFVDDSGESTDLSIDVFPLDETNPERKFFRAFQNRVKMDLYFAKLYKVSRMGNREPYKPGNPFKRLYVAVLSLLSLKTIDKWDKKILTAEKHNCAFYVNWGAAYSYKRATYPKEAFGTPEKRAFENTYVWSEEHPEMILERLYGKNYMELPPVEKRTDHGVKAFECAKLDFNRIKQEVGLE